MRRRQIQAERTDLERNTALQSIREAMDRMTAEDIGGTQYVEPKKTLTLRKVNG